MESLEPKPEGAHDPLRNRMPGYLASFGTGLAATVAVGFVVWAVTNVSLVSGVANTIFIYGIVLMFVGGVAGGGNTNRGVGGTGIGATRGRETRDHGSRYRRPEASPTPFWQVVGGGIYVAIGLFIAIVWS